MVIDKLTSHKAAREAIEAAKAVVRNLPLARMP